VFSAGDGAGDGCCLLYVFVCGVCNDRFDLFWNEGVYWSTAECILSHSLSLSLSLSLPSLRICHSTFALNVFFLLLGWKSCWCSRSCFCRWVHFRSLTKPVIPRPYHCLSLLDTVPADRFCNFQFSFVQKSARPRISGSSRVKLSWTWVKLKFPSLTRVRPVKLTYFKSWRKIVTKWNRTDVFQIVHLLTNAKKTHNSVFNRSCWGLNLSSEKLKWSFTRVEVGLRCLITRVQF
jgi:hypothetical protein